MNEINKVIQIRKINRIAEIKNSSSRGDNYDSYKFYCIDKIILSEDMEFQEKCEFLYKAVIRFTQTVKTLDTPIVYMIRSNSKESKLNIYIGISKIAHIDIGEIFKAFFQNVKYHQVNIENSFNDLNSKALLTGIPFAEDNDKAQDYIGPVVKYIKDKDVLIELIARPIKTSNLEKQINYLLKEKSENSESIKIIKTTSTGKTESFSSTKGVTRTEGNNEGVGFIASTGSNYSSAETQTDNDSDSTTITNGKNIDRVNAYANEYDKILEQYIERLTKALTSGLWQTCVTVSCEDDNTLDEACGIFSAVYNNKAVEAFKMHKLEKASSALSIYVNNSSNPLGTSVNIFNDESSPFSYINGEELSMLFDLPKEEYHGYQVDYAPRFSQNIAIDNNKNNFVMGQLYDGEVKSNIDFSFNNEMLCKHLLVAGITGSGKTNTVFNILKNIHVPFLVLEPAKKEYRSLKPEIPDLRVYTLGDENISPFRLNPFYFGRNVSIQQHIDNIKVIFTASFAMYASMPNILEQCLNNIYIKKGWSLTTSENIYEKDGVIHQEYYPTIEDLYYEIDTYMSKLGYAQEQTQNIRAALLTRIKSLMIGGKGFMLNTVETIDMKELLAYPTVLELEAVADDDEKSLIIGFIAMNIYEHLKSNTTNYNEKLKHLLVFEEAHRIFKNSPQSQNQEVSNISGKAIENLSNILCEVRAYGQGMLIVDQVPTKLASDVLKNTNTKIIQRLVSKDDCEYVSNSLGLKDDKVDYISKLTNGSALILTEGMSYPAHVKIKLEKGNQTFIGDKKLKELAKEYNNLAENPRNIHPLTDLLMQHNPPQEELQLIGKNLFKNFISGDVAQFKSYINISKKEFIDFASRQGFDINIKREEFVNSIIEEILNYVVKTEESLVNNLNKTLKHKKYIEACLYLCEKCYEDNTKEFKLLELSRSKL